MEDVEKDRQRAEVFDALGHPTRITILKALDETPLGFADLKKRLNIESSGHLQHHLSKLGNLTKIDERGRYCLSEYGKDALFAVQTVEKVVEPRIKRMGHYSKGTAGLLLLLALLLLVAFVWLQLASVSNPNFLLLTFSSFVFLAAGTFLTLRTFAKSSEKQLCLTVAILFLTVTLLVAFSLAQFPRGGFWNRQILVTPENFTLSIENIGGNYYEGHSQIIYSAKYPVSRVFARTPSMTDRVITIGVSSPVNLQGWAYIFLIFKPYAEMTYAFFQKPISFNENSSRFWHYEIDLWLEWGTLRTRFEGYELEFLLRLDLQGSEAGPSNLNFTVDTTFFKIFVDDCVVDSSFQNSSCTTLAGIFIGLNAYIPGKYMIEYFPKKLAKEEKTNLDT
jgi:DNA-binding transcriptional ArsR family regulator